MNVGTECCFFGDIVLISKRCDRVSLRKSKGVPEDRCKPCYSSPDHSSTTRVSWWCRVSQLSPHQRWQPLTDLLIGVRQGTETDLILGVPTGITGGYSACALQSTREQLRHRNKKFLKKITEWQTQSTTQSITQYYDLFWLYSTMRFLCFLPRRYVIKKESY